MNAKEAAEKIMFSSRGPSETARIIQQAIDDETKRLQQIFREKNERCIELQDKLYVPCKNTTDCDCEACKEEKKEKEFKRLVSDNKRMMKTLKLARATLNQGDFNEWEKDDILNVIIDAWTLINSIVLELKGGE